MTCRVVGNIDAITPPPHDVDLCNKSSKFSINERQLLEKLYRAAHIREEASNPTINLTRLRKIERDASFPNHVDQANSSGGFFEKYKLEPVERHLAQAFFFHRNGAARSVEHRHMLAVALDTLASNKTFRPSFTLHDPLVKILPADDAKVLIVHLLCSYQEEGHKQLGQELRKLFGLS